MKEKQLELDKQTCESYKGNFNFVFSKNQKQMDNFKKTLDSGRPRKSRKTSLGYTGRPRHTARLNRLLLYIY